MLLAVLLLAAAEVSAAADNRTCSAAELDSHERAFWACLGPWGYSSGAHDILLVNTSMSHMSMDMGVGSGHIHDAEFCYSLIGESNFCVCTAPLRQLAQCGHTLAAETLESYQPWCQAKRSCPELAPELLKTSMMCTAEGLNAANESDVICAYEHELVQEAMRDRVQALNEQLTSGHYHLPAGMHLPHFPPPSPPGTAHGQCGHAVKDLFNASMRVNMNSLAHSPNLNAADLDGLGLHDGNSVFFNMLHRDTYHLLSGCLERAHVSEESLKLPIPLGTLFGNGSIISYESLTSHVCGHEATHGWLADSIEKYTGLKFLEEEWADSTIRGTPGKVEAGGIILAWLFIITMMIFGCVCCVYKGGCAKCLRGCQDETPVLSTYGERHKERAADALDDADVHIESEDVSARHHGSVA